MKSIKQLLFLLSALLLLAHVQADTPSDITNLQNSSDVAAFDANNLTDAQMLMIGKKIWQNQSGGTIAGITSWDNGGFAYIGINESIWYAQNDRKAFQEDWPRMALYLKDHGFPIEDWMLGYCPWGTKEEFIANLDGPQLTLLRTILSTDEAVIAQARCVAERLKESLPKMLEGLSAEEAARVQTNFERVAQEPLGVYALIDYVNFKGEGTLETERFNGEGWGLLQVLEAMSSEGAAVPAFVDAAEIVLKRLIQNHPSASRCLAGWEAHLRTYLAE